jgi:hypothetical protein
MSAMQRDIAAD